MLEYTLKVSICWIAFYAIYYAFLRKETFFKINRVYLLVTLCLGGLIPMLHNLFIIAPTNNMTAYLASLDLNVLNSQNTLLIQDEAGTLINWFLILCLVYIIGVIISSSRFVFGLFKIHSLYRQAIIENHGELLLVRSTQAHLPFSFFNMLFISNSYNISKKDEEKIILHEKAHVEGRHSYDVVLVELLAIVFWFNPLIYFYKTSLKTVHEYLADERVLQTMSTNSYGKLLLNQPQFGWQVAIATPFAHSQIKQRIIMMTNSKSSRKNLMKYTLFLPIFCFLLLTCTNDNAKNYSDIDTNPLNLIENSLAKISINKLGSFLYEDVSISERALSDLMKGMKGETILVEPHPKAPIERVVRVMDLSTRYKIETVLKSI